jgi:hypothetical protein
MWLKPAASQADGFGFTRRRFAALILGSKAQSQKQITSF